jgi:hypothetical protein
VCRTSLVAIDGYGNPLVTETLHLLTKAPSLLNALLAIASRTRMRYVQFRPDASTVWSPYDRALTEVQRAISLSDNDSDLDALLAAVIGAHILVILSIEGLDDWQHHASHIVHLIDCSDVNLIKSSESGMYPVMFAAHVDIGAFALGRSTISTHAWSRWQLDKGGDETNSTFCPHEIVTGYPSSLLSLIAEVENCALQFRFCENVPGHQLEVATAERARLQVTLESWEPPPLISDMQVSQKLALQIARRTMHRAVILYHARMHGFYANLLTPLDHYPERARLAMVEDVVFGIRHLIHAFHAHGMPIANAMAWPLAVAGGECSSGGTRSLQPEILALIDETASSFQMSHLQNLKLVLQALWQQASSKADQSDHLSIESVARECNLTVFLV